jgi:hypothetical protein
MKKVQGNASALGIGDGTGYTATINGATANLGDSLQDYQLVCFTKAVKGGM